MTEPIMASRARWDALRERHPYLLRWEALPPRLAIDPYAADAMRVRSNASLARAEAEQYVYEARRRGSKYYATLEYWTGREWITMESWSSHAGE